jgi:copper chaperone CopZ
MTTITVTAPDISCGNCVAHIEKDISVLAGVASVKADESSKQVTITYDETTLNREQITRFSRQGSGDRRQQSKGGAGCSAFHYGERRWWPRSTSSWRGWSIR